MKDPLEKEIEKKGCEYAFKRGWLEFKTVSPSRRGFPDRTYIRRGSVIFVEWKRADEDATVQQKKLHKEMRKHGAVVYVINNLEDAYAVFD